MEALAQTEPAIPVSMAMAPARIMIADVRRAVAQQFGVTEQEIDSRARTTKINHVRQIAFYLSRIHAKRSLPEIGRRIGQRDHTTVLHAIKKIEAMRLVDSNLDGDLCQIERHLSETAASRAAPVPADA